MCLEPTNDIYVMVSINDMIDILLFKLGLAFTIGGIWVTISTIIAEKLGTRPGALIGGLPSTVVVASFFIGWTQSPMEAVQSTTIIPVILGIDALFVVIFILLSGDFHFALCASLSIWTALSLGFVCIEPPFLISLIGCFVFLVVSYYILEKKMDIKSVSQKETRYTISQLLLRAILSGTIIVFAVIVAEMGGPLLGGMFAAFPAIFLSSIIITYKTHGREFSGAFMKVLMMSGCSNVAVYSIGVRYFVLPLGILCGIVLSFALSILCSSLLYVFIVRKMT